MNVSRNSIIAETIMLPVGDNMKNYLGVGVLVLGLGVGSLGIGSLYAVNQYSAKTTQVPAYSTPARSSIDVSGLENRISGLEKTINAMATKTADYQKKDEAHYQRTYKIQQEVEALMDEAGIPYLTPTPARSAPSSAPKK